MTGFVAGGKSSLEMANDSKSKLDQFVDDFLTCQFCKQRFKEPTVLSCSHTFCRECIDDLLNIRLDDTVTCPICRDNVLVSNRGVTATKKNTFVEFLLKYVCLIESFASDSDELKRSCKVCESEDVSHYCQECAGVICPPCEHQHERMEPFKAHRVINIKEVLDGELTDVIRMLSKGETEEGCTTHTGEPLRFYCQRCHIAICRDCTVVDHNIGNHGVTELNGIATVRRKMLAESLERLSEKKSRNAKFVSSKEQAQKSILEKKMEARKAIENAATELVQEIEGQKKTLLDKIEKTTAAKLMRVMQIYEESERDLKEMTVCCYMSHLLMETGRDSDVVHMSGVLHQAMKKHRQKDNVTFACGFDRFFRQIVFKPNMTAEDINLGGISIIQKDQRVNDS